MSYDIMVFDRQKKFVDVKEFLNWYDEVKGCFKALKLFSSFENIFL